MFQDLLYDHEALVRLASFIGVFAVFAIWELLAPRRARQYSKGMRWLNNLSLTFLNTLIIRLAIPLTVVATAAIAQQQNLGLLHKVGLPTWLLIAIAVLMMDLVLYLQHLVFHHVHFLWRLHRMHHADLDFDVTTGIRFHPIEIILSTIIKVTVVLMLGAPIAAVIIFEVLLNATSLFNHANIYIPKKMDQVLRWFLVTPDMHRVHHSVILDETNSNFGFNLPWWDYLFKTYRAQPKAGHIDMTIGIEYFRTKRDLWFDRMLMQPFKNPTKDFLDKSETTN